MNENLNLVEILKDCPEGFKLYTPLFGEVELKVIGCNEYPIITTPTGDDCSIAAFTKEGFYHDRTGAECLLFPSKEQRDWSKFKAPWLEKKKFDPTTLKPFDRVLVRDTYCQNWTCGFFSHIVSFNNISKYNIGEVLYKMCIPYNDDTKHLVGTECEAPEFYRYWED